MDSRGPVLLVFLRLFIFLTFFQVFLVGMTVLRNKAGLAQGTRQPASEAGIQCGMFNNKILYQDQVYPPVPLAPECPTKACEISRYARDLPQAGTETPDVHIVSVAQGRPNPKLRLGEVELHLKPTERPVVLILTNRESTVWHLKTLGDVSIQEVIVASSKPTWLQGLSPDVPYTYLSESEMCAYPSGWEEHKNPNNEYLRMIHALRIYAGQVERSFQGAQVGHRFEVPYYEDLSREIAAITAYQEDHREALKARRELLPRNSQGLKYRVRHHHLVTEAWASIAADGRVQRQLVPLRSTVQAAAPSPHGLFVLEKFRLSVWEGSGKRNERWLQPSMELPDLKWPTSVHYDAAHERVLIPDRWQELIFAYHPVSQEWSLFSKANVGRLLAMTSHPSGEGIYALQEDQGLARLLLFHPEGPLIRTVPLQNAPPFLESEWKVEMKTIAGELYVRVIRPHRPRGDYYHLDPKSGVMTPAL